MKDADDNDPGHLVLYLLSVLQKRVQRALDSELKQSIDERLSISHGDILFYLFMHRRARIGEITRHLGVTKSTMTVLIRKLETLGLVERSVGREDGRTAFLELSSGAHAVMDRAREVGTRTRRRLLADLPDEDVRELVRLLSLLKEATQDW